MRIAALAFRFRVFIFLFLYLLGFLPPWERLLGRADGLVWLGVATQLARSGWFSLAGATLAVTLAALACLALGTALRLWGTAYLGSSTMRGAALRGESIVAAGPYARLRNPLYLGSWFLAVGSSILMPPSGALFFLVAFTAFALYLISAEERFLSATGGAAYEQYRRQVPRLLPRLTRTPVTFVRPRWLQALPAEAYPISFTLCFAVFAWRYNARILIRCLLICYGLSLVFRAFIKEPPDSQKSV